MRIRCCTRLFLIPFALLVQACSASSDDGGSPSLTGPETGSLGITISTTGSGIAPDGYFLAVDGAVEQRIEADGALTIDGVSVGSHSVVLSGESPDCKIGGANPRTVTVLAGELASTVFEVGCAAPLRGQIVFASRPRSASGGLSRLYRMNLDGTGRMPLGTVQRDLFHLSVSPDGRRIYYGTFDPEISVVNADGAIPRRLSSDGFGPTVSPDGTVLAFIHGGELRVMPSDGGKPRTVVVPLPPKGAESRWSPPIASHETSWSPDGTRIAFEGGSDVEDSSIFVVNVDGTDLRELTRGATSPSWSPDGSRIAFIRWGESSAGLHALFTMRPDGTDLVRLTSEDMLPHSVRWSPDGTQLVFVEGDQIYRVRADGSGLENLSNDVANEDHSPAYTP